MGRGRGRGQPPRSTEDVSESDWQDILDDPTGFDPDELREFLAADLMDVPTRPGFKERLRRKLWLMVKLRYGGGSTGPS